MTRKDTAWKEEFVAKTFLDGVRGGIPFAREQAEVLVRLLRALDRPVERFVDVGCGAGELAGVVLDAFPSASATLVDFSEPMLREARARFDGKENVSIVEADFKDASWVDSVKGLAPLDAIVSGFAIHHQADSVKKRLYNEIFELLRPGGMFVNVEHVASRSEWGKKISESFFIDSIVEYNRGKGTDKSREEAIQEFFNRPDKDANLLTPVEVQCDWLWWAGFTEVDCFFKAFEMAVFGGRRPADGKDEKAL